MSHVELHDSDSLEATRNNICLFSQVDDNTDLWLEIAFHIQVILSYLKLVGIYSSNKNVIKYQVPLVLPTEYFHFNLYWHCS